MEHHFNVKIAKEYGINIAIFLNNMSFWIQKNIANRRNYRDGRYWTYNSFRAFSEIFEYFTERQIRFIIKNCLEKNLIVEGNYNQTGFDRTKWYAFTETTMNLFGLSNIVPTATEMYFDQPKIQETKDVQNCQTHVTKLSNGSDRIVTPIPYINNPYKKPVCENLDRTEQIDCSEKQQQHTQQENILKSDLTPQKEISNRPTFEIITTQPMDLEKLKQEAITDEKCVKLFNDKKLDEQTTIAELYDECSAHYAIKGQIVYKSRFLSWIKRENVLNIKQYPEKSTKVAGKSENAYNRRLEAQEEAAKKQQYKEESQQVKKIVSKISSEARSALFAAIGKGRPK